MINVTKTYLPDRKELGEYIDKIYNSGKITNNGEFVKLLEKKLEKYLGVKNIVLVSNGTLALQIAYKLLDLRNEVITTPFSFVATTSSLVWEGIKPVFCDIDKNTFCIDYRKIEEKITKNTTAIVPVHVFGNACEVEQIEKIANKYNLKVIYDAAHTFGINYKGKSILNYGDISTLSFHATKVFHTIEGGALIIKDDCICEKARRMINFGIMGPEKIDSLGINAKMNEFEAAMGLCIIDKVEQIEKKRKEAYYIYMSSFKENRNVILQQWNLECSKNYGYFPILLKDEKTLLNIKEQLEKNNIFPRRYFYPSLDTLEYIKSEYMEISNDISKRILCLPISSYISKKEVNKVVTIINGYK